MERRESIISCMLRMNATFTLPKVYHEFATIFVVTHTKYNISLRNYPGDTEQKLSPVV
jgi:hypothetical protein